MNYASIKSCDIANGPGVRVSLFVSGCTHHCKDCFNEEAWDFSYGEPFTDAVMDGLLAMLAPGYIRGITYLGGEPFDPHNQESLLLLSRRIRQELPEKSHLGVHRLCLRRESSDAPRHNAGAFGASGRSGRRSVHCRAEKSLAALPGLEQPAPD